MAPTSSYFRFMAWITIMSSVYGFCRSTLSTTTKPSLSSHTYCRRSHTFTLSQSSKSDSASESSKTFQGSRQQRQTRARDLILSLVHEEQCFTTESGAVGFANSCAINVLYEDCYEPQPFVGRTVSRASSCLFRGFKYHSSH